MNEMLIENHGAVRVLTMNRPEKRNALNTALTQALLDALRAADADDSVHCVVLAGAGQGFCAGADLSEFKDLTPEKQHLVEARSHFADHRLQVGGEPGARLDQMLLFRCEVFEFG